MSSLSYTNDYDDTDPPSPPRSASKGDNKPKTPWRFLKSAVSRATGLRSSNGESGESDNNDSIPMSPASAPSSSSSSSSGSGANIGVFGVSAKKGGPAGGLMALAGFDDDSSDDDDDEEMEQQVKASSKSGAASAAASFGNSKPPPPPNVSLPPPPTKSAPPPPSRPASNSAPASITTPLPTPTKSAAGNFSFRDPSLDDDDDDDVGSSSAPPVIKPMNNLNPPSSLNSKPASSVAPAKLQTSIITAPSTPSSSSSSFQKPSASAPQALLPAPSPAASQITRSTVFSFKDTSLDEDDEDFDDIPKKTVQAAAVTKNESKSSATTAAQEKPPVALAPTVLAAPVVKLEKDPYSLMDDEDIEIAKMLEEQGLLRPGASSTTGVSGVRRQQPQPHQQQPTSSSSSAQSTPALSDSKLSFSTTTTSAPPVVASTRRNSFRTNASLTQRLMMTSSSEPLAVQNAPSLSSSPTPPHPPPSRSPLPESQLLPVVESILDVSAIASSSPQQQQQQQHQYPHQQHVPSTLNQGIPTSRPKTTSTPSSNGSYSALTAAVLASLAQPPPVSLSSSSNNNVVFSSSQTQPSPHILKQPSPAAINSTSAASTSAPRVVFAPWRLPSTSSSSSSVMMSAAVSSSSSSSVMTAAASETATASLYATPVASDRSQHSYFPTHHSSSSSSSSYGGVQSTLPTVIDPSSTLIPSSFSSSAATAAYNAPTESVTSSVSRILQKREARRNSTMSSSFHPSTAVASATSAAPNVLIGAAGSLLLAQTPLHSLGIATSSSSSSHTSAPLHPPPPPPPIMTLFGGGRGVGTVGSTSKQMLSPPPRLSEPSSSSSSSSFSSSAYETFAQQDSSRKQPLSIEASVAHTEALSSRVRALQLQREEMAAKLTAPRLHPNSSNNQAIVEQQNNDPTSLTNTIVYSKVPSPPHPPPHNVALTSTAPVLAVSLQQSSTPHPVRPSGLTGAPSTLLKLATSSRKGLISSSQSASADMALRLQEAVLNQHQDHQLYQHQQQQQEKENISSSTTTNDNEPSALQLWAAANDAAKRAEMAVAETAKIMMQPTSSSSSSSSIPTLGNNITPTLIPNDSMYSQTTTKMAPEPLVSSALPRLLHPSASEIAIPAFTAARSLAIGYPAVLLGYSARALFIEHKESSPAPSSSPRSMSSASVCSLLSPVHPSLMLPLLETMGLLPVLPQVGVNGEIVNDSLFLRHDDPNAHRPFRSASVLLTKQEPCLFRSSSDGRTLRWYPLLESFDSNIDSKNINRASNGHKTGEVPLFSITEAELLKTSPAHLRIKAQVAVPLSIIFTDHSISNSDPDGILGKIARVLSSGPATQGVPPSATHALVLINFRLALGSEKERHDFIQGLVLVRAVCPVPEAVADVFMSQDEIAAISSTREDEDEIQLSRPTQQFIPLPSPPPPPPQTYAPLPTSSMQPVSLADHIKWLQLNGGIETKTHSDEGDEDEEEEENDEEGEEMRRSVALYSTSAMRVSQMTPSSNLSAPTGVTSAHGSVVSSPLLSLGRPSLNSFAPPPSPVVRLATVNVQPSVTPMQMQQQPYASSGPSASRVLRPRNVSASSLLAGSGGSNSAHFNNNNNTSLVQLQQQQHHQNQLMSRSVMNNPQNTLVGGGNYPHAIGGTSSAMASSAAIAASVARMNVRGGGGGSATSRSGGGRNTGDQHHLGSGLMMTRPQTALSSSSSVRVKETTSIPSLQFSTPFRVQSTQGAPYSSNYSSQQRVFFDDVPSVSIGRGPR